jgi:hypothetical protein
MGVGGGVQRIEVAEREKSVFGGTEFGTVGTYERLHGTVFGELDPTHPLNAGIVNLGRATRNTRGNVEYQSDFRISSSVSGSRTRSRIGRQRRGWRLIPVGDDRLLGARTDGYRVRRHRLSRVSSVGCGRLDLRFGSPRAIPSAVDRCLPMASRGSHRSVPTSTKRARSPPRSPVPTRS